ncbi:SPOR domain-containing protein [Legionella sp. W05-934-2]|uniref:SPOR domain-containing protein n=1 Tax=Legionella sp. W05-934-2 TaxID=1198649 RepID=UPI0034617C24
MKYLIPFLLVLLCSCSTTSYYRSTSYIPYQGYTYDEYDSYYGSDGGNYYDGQQGYYQRDYGDNQGQSISVPNSYHVGRYRSPQSPQSRDEQWVNRQQSGGYTIEISRGSKASQVAKELMHAPKNNRTAAVRSGEGYVGVYGSYPNYEDARRAYDNLPTDLRGKARIKSWGSVR